MRLPRANPRDVAVILLGCRGEQAGCASRWEALFEGWFLRTKMFCAGEWQPVAFFFFVCLKYFNIISIPDILCTIFQT